jgi:hypothetical protein
MKLKTCLMIAAAAIVVAASPAFAAGPYATTHESRVRDYGAYNYGPSPGTIETPATTGGGSIGYDNHLTKNY